MKFPNHILLDVNKPNMTFAHDYWIFKYLFTFSKNLSFSNHLSFYQKFLFSKDSLLLNEIIKNQKKYTIKYSHTNLANFLSEEQQLFYKNVFTPRLKVKHRVLDSKHFTKEIYDYLTNSELQYDEKSLRLLVKNFSFKKKAPIFKSNKLWALFNINFLRKERIYTKLKYSRVPQYDIVSGGAALLFGGFLGFLICEKFGFELLDSGDFYFLFMYVVFLCFAIRLFLKIMDANEPSWNVFSLKWLIYFLYSILNFFVKFIKRFF